MLFLIENRFWGQKILVFIKILPLKEGVGYSHPHTVGGGAQDCTPLSGSTAGAPAADDASWCGREAGGYANSREGEAGRA